MRIHEILETCVDYIAIDGVLGTDPAVLQQYLSTLDKSIDPAYFTHIYSLLTDHPSIQVIVTSYPLPSPCTTHTGTAPLPNDYISQDPPPDVNLEALFKEGVRGRQMAYHLAGEEYQTGKQAIEAKREVAKKVQAEKKAVIVKGKRLESADLYQVLKPGHREDLMELWEIWGARLRLRATDDEIYFRLTGSHTKISKLSPVVFHTLSLAARSREKGITSIELGPMVGTSQGSMHYFMKVLVDMGLCAKIPAVLHGSITNLLVFHRFVEQNPNYRAILAQKQIGNGSSEAATLLNLNFPTLTEQDLMAGHIVKERLIRLLDHPSLENHLLRAKNLLPLIGWQGPHVTRHSRAMLRHADALISEGIIESVSVGADGVKCLRLTKYNPEFVFTAIDPLVDEDEENIEVNNPLNPETNYNPLGGASATQSIEHQMTRVIVDSGQSGMTIANIRDALGGIYKRAVEFHVLHAETYVSPHLRNLATCIVMEMVGRERRLRAFGVTSYRARMQAENQFVDDTTHPPEPPESGHWSDLSHLQFYSSIGEYHAVLDNVQDSPENLLKPTRVKPKHTRSESIEPSKKRQDKYPNDVQSRGRPRKYVYVVNEDGKRNRAIVGSIYSTPDLPPILIYVKSVNKMVAAPPGYSGVGPPPPITPEQIAAGQTPKSYWKYPTHSPAVGNLKAIQTHNKAQKRQKSKKKVDSGKKGDKRKREASPRDQVDQLEPEEQMDDENQQVGRTKRLKIEPGVASDMVTEAPITVVDDVDPGNETVVATLTNQRESPSNLQPPTDAAPKKRPPKASTASNSSNTPAGPISDPPEPLFNFNVTPPTTTFKLPTEISGILRPDGADSEDDDIPTMSFELPPEFADFKRAPDTLPVPPPQLPVATSPRAAASAALVTKHTLPTLDSPKPRRPDLGQHRRANELYQCLVDNDGIMVLLKLMHEHRNWANRVAGTDWPNAPTVAASMDRKTFHKAISGLVNDGRFRETIATIPTTTGRWQKTSIVYLSDQPQEKIQSYIRAIAADITPSSHRKPKPIPETTYTEIARKPLPPLRESHVETNRDTLLRDPSAVAYLYGFQSARMARAEIIHRALIRNLSTSPSTLSTSPHIIALPLFFEDVSIGEWLQCIATFYYDSGLEELARSNPETKLRNVPKQLRPSGGFGGFSSKGKLTKLLDILTTLKLITPLALTEDDPLFKLPSGHLGLGATCSAKYFLVHDHAPVYHFAADTSRQLGLVPVRSLTDLDNYWQAAKRACLEPDGRKLPPLPEHETPGFPFTADLTTGTTLGVEKVKLFRSLARWKHHYRLHPLQQAALHDAYKANPTADEIASFAHQYALPVSYVTNQIQIRRERAANRRNDDLRAAKETEAQRRARQRRAQEMVQIKVLERAAAARKEWEDRIRAGATRVGVQYEDAVFAFVSRQRLQHLTVEWTDSMIDDAVQAYVRSKNVVPKDRTSTTKWKPKRKTASDPLKPVNRMRRRRYDFTPEDDDKLLDCEAICRARQRPSKGGTQRMAFQQIFPSLGRQTLASRVKRIASAPGKQAYLDRLEEAWYQMWVEHRGVDLPDPDFKDLVTFDLKAHLQYLRDHVNKLHIRLAVAMPMAQKDRAPDLPAKVDALLSTRKFKIKPCLIPGFIFPTSIEAPVLSEDTRLLNMSLGSILHEAPPETPTSTRDHAIVQSAIKMIIVTPADQYNVQAAADLIQPYEKLYNRDIMDMIDQGILLKHHIGKYSPGRQYGFASLWLEKGEGPYPMELHDTAEHFKERFTETDSIEWPLVGTSGGDMAALLQMVSNHEVDIKFDSEDFPTLAIEQLTYNTKALNDDSFEFDLEISRIDPSRNSSTDPGCPRPEIKEPRAWSLVVEFDVSEIANRIYLAVKESKGQGLTKDDLENELHLPGDHLTLALASMAEERPARVFWAGYDTSRLVAMDHHKAWTVEVRQSENEITTSKKSKSKRVTPRKWLNIWGEPIQDEWTKTVRAVRAHLVSRPGINETKLRELLYGFLDRLEANDVLQYLLDTRQARRGSLEKMTTPIEATDVTEEHKVTWWPDTEVLWH